MSRWSAVDWLVTIGGVLLVVSLSLLWSTHSWDQGDLGFWLAVVGSAFGIAGVILYWESPPTSFAPAPSPSEPVHEVEWSNMPILGWREWRLVKHDPSPLEQLAAELDGNPTEPRFALYSTAMRTRWDSPTFDAECGHHVREGRVPHDRTDCGDPPCGIYAYQRPPMWGGAAIGIVALSGRVIVGDNGYRAERAEIVALAVRPESASNNEPPGWSPINTFVISSFTTKREHPLPDPKVQVVPTSQVGDWLTGQAQGVPLDGQSWEIALAHQAAQWLTDKGFVESPTDGVREVLRQAGVT